MTDDDAAQCAKDIASWFSDKAGEGKTSGANASDLERVSKAAGENPALEAMLREIDGGIWYYESQALDTAAIVEKAAALDGVLPFAADVDDNMLVVLAAGDGPVVEWDADDGAGEELAASFADFLEQYSKKLLSGQWEFVEECGVMQKMGGGGK